MTPPNQDYTLDFASMVSIAALYNHHLRAFAAGNGHPLCDAAAQLEATPENFFDDCHFNAQGSRRMSEILERCLAIGVPGITGASRRGE